MTHRARRPTCATVVAALVLAAASSPAAARQPERPIPPPKVDRPRETAVERSVVTVGEAVVVVMPRR